MNAKIIALPVFGLVAGAAVAVALPAGASGSHGPTGTPPAAHPNSTHGAACWDAPTSMPTAPTVPTPVVTTAPTCIKPGR